MTPRVFGIGEGKSGSCSLAAALDSLGMTTVHLGHPDSQHLRSLVDRNASNGLPIVDGISGVDALVEIQTHYQRLDEQLPDAKFILTYRPPDDAAFSWCRMVSERYERFPIEWASYTGYAEKVRRHVDAVVRHFYGRPHKLLLLDVRDGDATKWRLLTTFLELKPIGFGVPYPRRFDHCDWQYR